MQEWLGNGWFWVDLELHGWREKARHISLHFVEDVSGKPRMIQLKAEPWILMGNVCGAQLIHGS